MAMKKRNRERTREKRRKIHKNGRKGKERKRKENQTMFCNGHCGQQKLPLQLMEEPEMGQQSLLI